MDYIEYHKLIILRINKIIDSSGLSLKEICMNANISYYKMKKFISIPEYDMSIDVLDGFCEYFGIQLSELISHDKK